MHTNYPVQGNLFLGRTEKVMDSDFLKKYVILGRKCQKQGFSSFMKDWHVEFSDFLHKWCKLLFSQKILFQGFWPKKRLKWALNLVFQVLWKNESELTFLCKISIIKA